MKKLSVFLILAIAAFAFVGCSDDDATSLRWKNDDANISSAYDEIQWIKSGDTTSFDQSWNGVPDSTTLFTEYKEVNALNGTGELLGDSGTAMIVFDETDSSVAGVKDYSGNSAQLEKGADATLVIFSAKKK